jgi:hypothetical protein
MVDFFHGYGLPVILHTCGSTAQALPLILEAGFDGLNPMERKAKDNDPEARAVAVVRFIDEHNAEVMGWITVGEIRRLGTKRDPGSVGAPAYFLDDLSRLDRVFPEIEAPERFAALALLEPVLLPRHVMLEWRLVRALGLGQRLHPLIPGALRRQREFPSLESAFERYRARRIFRYFSDDALRTYIAGMTTGSPGNGFRLVYTPEWEARIYDTGVWNDWDLWRGMPSLRVPTLMVRGAESDTFRESTTRTLARRNGQVRIAVVERSTHLMPLERPQMVFDLARSFLENVAR